MTTYSKYMTVQAIRRWAVLHPDDKVTVEYVNLHGGLETMCHCRTVELGWFIDHNKGVLSITTDT